MCSEYLIAEDQMSNKAISSLQQCAGIPKRTKSSGVRGARVRLPKTAAQGLKKGALSKFMEDAVKWRLFDQTIIEVRKVFTDMPMADELENLIDEAVASVRKERCRERKRRSKR
jgi:hypothetical protein